MQTTTHAKQIEKYKKEQLKSMNKTKKEGEGTFLTGLGIAN